MRSAEMTSRSVKVTAAALAVLCIALAFALALALTHAAANAGANAAALQTPGKDGGTSPEFARDLDRVIEETVGWLVTNQAVDGGWGTHRTARVGEVLADIPGSHNAFRVATSALCVIALEDSPFKTTGSRSAAGKGIDYLLGFYNVKRPDGTEHYTVWALGYALQCFGEWLTNHPDDPRAGRIRSACVNLIEKLGRYQSLDGGWGYLSLRGLKTYQPASTSMTFTTSAILVGIDRARRAGVEAPGKLVERAVESVARARTPAGSYVYGEDWKYKPRMDVNQIKGSACRTPCCQYALMLFGREIGADERRKGLDDLLVRHIRFQKISVRYPIPHESWYQISGYFYLFGMAYRAYILDDLPEKDRGRFARPLFDAVMFCRQPDGSFWDYPLYGYHKPYGTAFALMTLSRLRR